MHTLKEYDKTNSCFGDDVCNLSLTLYRAWLTHNPACLLRLLNTGSISWSQEAPSLHATGHYIILAIEIFLGKTSSDWERENNVYVFIMRTVLHKLFLICKSLPTDQFDNIPKWDLCARSDCGGVESVKANSIYMNPKVLLLPMAECLGIFPVSVFMA